MINNLSYRNRIRWIYFGSVVFFILIYKLSISKTIECINKVRENEMQCENANSLPVQISELENKMHVYSDIKDTINEDDRQQKVLDKISQYCSNNQLIVRDFPIPTETREGEF